MTTQGTYLCNEDLKKNTELFIAIGLSYSNQTSYSD